MSIMTVANGIYIYVTLFRNILAQIKFSMNMVFIATLCLCFAQEHIQEIFSTYGKIKMVDMPMDRLQPHLSRGCAYVEFETPEEAQKALKHMDGGRPEYLFLCLCLVGLFSSFHICVE